MNYEEKYNKALEVMRQWIAPCHTKEQLDTLKKSVFPELAGSEYERIRRKMIEHFKAKTKETWCNMPVKDILAYLEKQKEQKPNYCHHEVDETGWTEEYRKAYYDGWNNCNMQHEQLKADQKPAELSEEDEDMLNSCISSIEEAKENRYAYKETDGDTSYDHEIAWLKSLRPQSREEIYQSAKHDLAIKFMNYLDENRPEGKMCLSNGECEDIDKAFKENDWAKILRYAEKYGK